MQDVSRKLTRRPFTSTHKNNTTISRNIDALLRNTSITQQNSFSSHDVTAAIFASGKTIKWRPCCVSKTNPVWLYNELFSHVKTLFCSNVAAVDHEVLKKYTIYLMSTKIVNSIFKFPQSLIHSSFITEHNVLIVFFKYDTSSVCLLEENKKYGWYIYSAKKKRFARQSVPNILEFTLASHKPCGRAALFPHHFRSCCQNNKARNKAEFNDNIVNFPFVIHALHIISGHSKMALKY